MSNVVKLILTCQVKDDYIPQLIPLIWEFSIFIILFIILIIINIYYYKTDWKIACEGYEIYNKVAFKW